MDIGGEDLDWIGDGKRQGHLGVRVGLIETVASSSMKRLAVTQCHVTDSEIVTSSTHVQHPQRLLQVRRSSFIFVLVGSLTCLQHLTQLDFSGCSSLSDEVTNCRVSVFTAFSCEVTLLCVPLPVNIFSGRSFPFLHQPGLHRLQLTDCPRCPCGTST